MTRRILALDGGGIKGVFSAAFLATIEESTGARIADHFDLIVGTSTGGIIALGLGLGHSAAEILRFYEDHAAEIFPERRGGLINRFFRPAFDSAALRAALRKHFGDARLGESSTRLVVPALTLETADVHLFKTAHHPRFERDFRIAAVDVAMATAAAPTYFREHLGSEGAALVDGGLWANNPTGLAVVEAIGVLGWQRENIHVLSLGCTSSPLDLMSAMPHRKGLGFYLTRIVDLMLAAHASGSMGTAAILVGHDHIHRVNVTVDRGRFGLASIARISDLRGLGQDEARKALPMMRSTFITQPIEPFVPYRNVGATDSGA
jgi:hypothetical protein